VFDGYRVAVWEDENVLKMADGNGCTTMHYETIKMVYFLFSIYPQTYLHMWKITLYKEIHA
jgi:hypothetical protein